MSLTSENVRPRAQVHRGTVVVAAWWFHPGIMGEAEARRRVLETWRPGVTVWALTDGYLLKLATPRSMAVKSAPGLPLVLESGVLTSAPLSPKERERLAPPSGAVVLVQAGIARVYGPGALRQVDPGAWLDVSAWRRVRVKGLGAPPAPMKSALEPVAAPTRERFGPRVPKLAPEAERMLERMAGREVPVVREGFFERLRRVFSRKPGEAVLTVRREGLFSRLRGAFRSQPAGPVTLHREGFFSRLRRAFSSETQDAPGNALAPRRAGWFDRLRSAFSSDAAHASAPGSGARAGWFSRLLAGMRGGDAAKASQGSAANARPAEPQGPGALERLKEWMLRNTPLGQLLGQRKGDYLRHLFELFEQGNLDEALRHAIPLGKDLDERAKLALGIPGPREELRIQPGGRSGAAQSFGGGPAVFEALRERYRETFRRLEREGRIDEAAFVLAELLDAAEEAVSFLERHGRLQLAAELAEGRNLPPGLVVRQWFLAKDVERAVAIARRSGVFADAVLRLEKTHPAEAQTLRLLWAESLAEAGDWQRAVNVVWPVASARHRARAWVEQGIQAGGMGGAMLLARLALGFPDGFGAARNDIQSLLSDDTPARAPERLAFATELLSENASDARSALLLPTVRALMRDEALEGLPSSAKLLQQIHALKDPALAALRTDLPTPRPSNREPWSESHDAHVRVWMGRSHAGAHAVHDAVVLPGRRVLLALGEAGARLVGADGRTLANFDVPAFSLVLSEQGHRALALARRGDPWRVSRLDLVERRATHWCDLELDAWAPTYDGERWFTAAHGTVSMVDTLAAEPRSLWRVSEVGGTVLRMAVDAKHLSFLVEHLTREQDFERLERWAYELSGGPVLRGRADMKDLRGAPDVLALTPDGEAMGVRIAVPEGEEPGPWPYYVAPIVARRFHRPSRPDGERVGVVLAHSWSATRFQKGELHTTVLRTVADHARVTVEFSGTPPQVVRLTEDWCAVHDLLGRVVWLDLHSGEVHRVPVV